MGLFDSTEEHPPAKVRRYVITGLAFVLLVVLGCWYLLRYHAEKNAVRQFLNTVAAGKMDDAYRIWKPSGTNATPSKSSTPSGTFWVRASL